jgi:hypothetical protein
MSKNMRVLLPDKLPEIYVNSSLSKYEPGQFTLDAGFLRPHTADGAAELAVAVRLMMSAHTVKKLVKTLSKQLEDYEEKYGEVKHDPEAPNSDEMH